MSKYEQALQAKVRAKWLLREAKEATGFGIAVLGDGEYGVKVNLTGPTTVLRPGKINGVKVIYEYPGEVVAQ